MSCNLVKNRCSVNCPKVREQLRNAIKELPNVTDGIFPRKKNDVEPRLPSDIIPKDKDEPTLINSEYVYKVVDHDELEELQDIKTEPVSPKIPTKEIIEDAEKKIDLIEKEKLIQEPTIIREEAVTPLEEIPNSDKKYINFIKEKELIHEPVILRKEEVATPEKKINNDEGEIDFIEKKRLVEEPVIVKENTTIPIKEVLDYDDKKIIPVKEKELIEKPVPILEEAIAPTITKHNEKKFDAVEEKELVQNYITIQEETPTIKVIENKKKIDLIEEKDLVVEEITVESVQKVPLIEPKIVKEEIKPAPTTKTDLQPSIELEEQFEPEGHMEYDEEEESVTDYEKFIDEELQEILPAVIASEIPEEPRVVHREIPRNAVTKKIDRERLVKSPRKREEVNAEMPKERLPKKEVSAKRVPDNSTVTERDVSYKPAEDICEEACPFSKEQRERIMRRLKAQQRAIYHYYLTKGYFENVCTCSLACMVYTLSRDPFMKSILASLALFAVGLKLCSELDAWEMPSRVL